MVHHCAAAQDGTAMAVASETVAENDASTTAHDGKALTVASSESTAAKHDMTTTIARSSTESSSAAPEKLKYAGRAGKCRRQASHSLQPETPYMDFQNLHEAVSSPAPPVKAPVLVADGASEVQAPIVSTHGANDGYAGAALTVTREAGGEDNMATVLAESSAETLTTTSPEPGSVQAPFKYMALPRAHQSLELDAPHTDLQNVEEQYHEVVSSHSPRTTTSSEAAKAKLEGGDKIVTDSEVYPDKAKIVSDAKLSPGEASLEDEGSPTPTPTNESSNGSLLELENEEESLLPVAAEDPRSLFSMKTTREKCCAKSDCECPWPNPCVSTAPCKKR